MNCSFVLSLILSLSLFSCSPPDPANGTQKAEDTAALVQKASVQEAPVIRDTSLYDPEFISGLSSCPGPVELSGSTVFFNKDSTHFPQWPAMNKEYSMTTTNDGEKFLLVLNRKRLSSLEYSMTQTNKNNMSVTRNSKAVLPSCFFLSLPAGLKPQPGKENYEYIDQSGECQVAILVQEGKKAGKVKVRVRYGCDNPVTLMFE